MSPIEEATTEELVEELRRRHDAVLLCGIRVNQEDEERGSHKSEWCAPYGSPSDLAYLLYRCGKCVDEVISELTEHDEEEDDE